LYPKRFVFKLLSAVALVFLAFLPAVSQASMVRVLTVLGPIDIALYDAAAPLTVANFLSYVNSGAYKNSFIHRNVPGFIIQGGGYTWENGVQTIAALGPVMNEYSASRPNVRGTVAMAKLGSDPNSATNQWFVNLADNSANLDVQNGGFAVFGQVTTSGMKVADAIAALSTVNACGINAGCAFTNLPITSMPATGSLQQGNLVMVNSASLIAFTSDSDRLFNYLEATYPQYLSLPGSASATANVNGTAYYYRYYPQSNSYIGTANGMVYYLVPAISGNITTLGTLAAWLATVAGAGY
jgi:peptidyl-prolyl cis-trans isomerase A (cyclophilin A)